MCFSATGSFAASGLLVAIGSGALSRITFAPYRMFAAIPLLFAAQQAAEGIVWLTMDQADHIWLQRTAVNVFLAFALVVWPLWLPLSLHRIEHGAVRRRALLGFICAGVVVSICATVLLIRWQPAAQMAGHSIRYVYSLGAESLRPGFYLAAYSIPTVVPFFISSASLARTTGVALILSLVAATAIERDALTSVWCFFAAVLSGLVLTAVILEQRLGGDRRSHHGLVVGASRRD